MAGHSFYGKQKICYTNVEDYRDFQGIGKDPLYKRYDSVISVVKRNIPTAYQHFLAAPEYIDADDQICWHIDVWNDTPARLTDLEEEERIKYERIKQETIAAYRASLQKLDGDDLLIMAGATRYIEDECIYCADGKVNLVAWGMTQDLHHHDVVGAVINEYKQTDARTIKFDAGEHGKLKNGLDKSKKIANGTILEAKDAPTIIADDGWDFCRWEPEFEGTTVSSDQTFTAEYKEQAKQYQEHDPAEETEDEANWEPETQEEEEFYYYCHFEAGANGELNGSPTVRKKAGSSVTQEETPTIKPYDGFEFCGWDTDPTERAVNSNMTFHAVYKQTPWYKQLQALLAKSMLGKGCPRWILWLLLFLLGIMLLTALLNNCHGCSNDSEIVAIGSRTDENGRITDDNGLIKPVTGEDGTLPPDHPTIVAPITGGEGNPVPIITQPGAPAVIANRLFLFLEDEDGKVEDLAKDFKAAYKGDQYAIVGYDKEVKMLSVQVPAEERDQIRRTINSRISNHRFIVFDEEIYELNGKESLSASNTGWHLEAIHLKEGWKVTKGTKNVKVAIVDDGIDGSHPMFEGRITEAYNVFTQNNALSTGDGHGTHTAGLAAGSDDFYTKGASGVAPNCMLMPIQVFDNNRCPMSALVAGVMYAVHHDADVVNISTGPSFKGLNALPVKEQDEIAKQQFKNVEKLWARVCSLASKKHCILVFAAGNDDILSSIPPENRNESAIVVAAVDKHLYPTDFTNYGPCTDITAPGKDIYSAYPGNAFKTFDGTSMSAPIVTGTIALMKSIKKDLTTTEAKNCLYNTGADVYGWIPPMVQVDKALAGVKASNFGTPKKRAIRNVPDTENDKGKGGEETKPAAKTETRAPQKNDETDYEAIRRKIAEYKQRITDLEKLLPNK